MKADTHPNYKEVQVTCSCGNTFTTRSTMGKPQLVGVGLPHGLDDKDRRLRQHLVPHVLAHFLGVVGEGPGCVSRMTPKRHRGYTRSQTELTSNEIIIVGNVPAPHAGLQM